MPRSKVSKSKNSQNQRADALREAMDRLHAGIDALFAVLAANAEPAVAGSRLEVMKPSDYADYMRVPVRKVHAWVKKGMPHFLVEGRVRLRARDADAWLTSRADAKGD